MLNTGSATWAGPVPLTSSMRFLKILSSGFSGQWSGFFLWTVFPYSCMSGWRRSWDYEFTIMKIMIIIMINNHQWWLILINRERLHFVYILTLIMLANLRFAMQYSGQLTITITHVTLIMLSGSPSSPDHDALYNWSVLFWKIQRSQSFSSGTTNLASFLLSNEDMKQWQVRISGNIL